MNISKAILVVDMQEDYLGVKGKYNLENKELLVSNIKSKIKSYNGAVIYIKNIGRTNSSDVISELKTKSGVIFHKERSSAFSNHELNKYLLAKKITEIEVVGIDGNDCVKTTSIDGIKNGYLVSIDLSCIGVINKIRFEKTLVKLKEYNVKIY